MPTKSRTSSTWQDIAEIKRYNGSSYESIAEARSWNGSEWVTVFGGDSGEMPVFTPSPDYYWGNNYEDDCVGIVLKRNGKYDTVITQWRQSYPYIREIDAGTWTDVDVTNGTIPLEFKNVSSYYINTLGISIYENADIPNQNIGTKIGTLDPGVNDTVSYEWTSGDIYMDLNASAWETHVAMPFQINIDDIQGQVFRLSERDENAGDFGNFIGGGVATIISYDNGVFKFNNFTADSLSVQLLQIDTKGFSNTYCDIYAGDIPDSPSTEPLPPWDEIIAVGHPEFFNNEIVLVFKSYYQDGGFVALDGFVSAGDLTRFISEANTSGAVYFDFYNNVSSMQGNEDVLIDRPQPLPSREYIDQVNEANKDYSVEEFEDKIAKLKEKRDARWEARPERDDSDNESNET